MKSFALITGASGGIGLAMARELAQRKVNVILVARSSEKLQEHCHQLIKEFAIEAIPCACDLSSPSERQKLLTRIKMESWNIHILINNAGYGLWGEVESSSLTELENMMQLNMQSIVQLTHSLLPELRKHPSAYILNVASTAAYQAVPFLTTYAATKAFVVLFSRGLRWELKDTTISVSCLSPGATSTGFIDRARMAPLKERADQFSMSSEEVARTALRGMFNRKAEIVPGFINWISVKLTYFFPKKITERIAYGLYKDTRK